MSIKTLDDTTLGGAANILTGNILMQNDLVKLERESENKMKFNKASAKCCA